MYHAAVCFFVLEMHEPVFTVFGMYPSSLMRSVDRSISLLQHYLMLVRTVGRLGAHCQLKTRGDTTSRTHNPIPTITLVELGTFAGAVLVTVAIEHDNGLTNGFHTIG